MAGQIRREIIRRIAERNGVPLATAEKIYRGKPYREQNRICAEIHTKMQKEKAQKP